MKYILTTQICILFFLLFTGINTMSAQNAKWEKIEDELIYYQEKGDSSFDSEKYKDAVKAYDKAIYYYNKLPEKNRQNTDVYIEVLYEKKAEALVELEKYDEAIVCYDAILALDCDFINTTIYFEKVYALFKLHKYDEALVCCDAAIIKIEKDGTSTWHLDGFYSYKGNIYEAKGEKFYKEARECYEKALELDPDNKEIKEELDALLLKMK